VALEGRTVIVPAIWALEITNALLVGERRKRVRQPDIRRFVELLRGLTITEHSQTIADTVINVLPLAVSGAERRGHYGSARRGQGAMGRWQRRCAHTDRPTAFARREKTRSTERRKVAVR
jgi:hypothetical protein